MNSYEKLHFITQYYQKPGSGVRATCECIAELLSNASRVHRDYTWNYILELLHKKKPLTRPIMAAVDLVYKAIQKGESCRLVEVVIIAPTGNVIPGSVCLCKSRVCPVCGTAFIQTHSSQRYDRIECRIKRRGRSGK